MEEHGRCRWSTPSSMHRDIFGHESIGTQAVAGHPRRRWQEMGRFTCPGQHLLRPVNEGDASTAGALVDKCGRQVLCTPHRTQRSSAKRLQESGRLVPGLVHLHPLYPGFQVLQEYRQTTCKPSCAQTSLPHHKRRFQEPPRRHLEPPTVPFRRTGHRSSRVRPFTLACRTAAYICRVSYKLRVQC